DPPAAGTVGWCPRNHRELSSALRHTGSRGDILQREAKHIRFHANRRRQNHLRNDAAEISDRTSLCKHFLKTPVLQSRPATLRPTKEPTRQKQSSNPL